MNREVYRKIMSYFEEHRRFCRALIMLERFFEILVIASYAMLLLYFIFSSVEVLLRSAVTSLVALYICTLIRFVMNRPRPYEKYEILPAMNKDTKGQSFPSRHATSAAVISVSMLYFNAYIGIAFVAVALAICTLRVLLGVHFIKDVTVGAAIGFVLGIIGLFII